MTKIVSKKTISDSELRSRSRNNKSRLRFRLVKIISATPAPARAPQHWVEPPPRHGLTAGLMVGKRLGGGGGGAIDK